MATKYSDQATKQLSPDYDMLSPHEFYGRRRVSFFSYVVPVGNDAIATKILAMKVPEGARLLGGTINTDGAGAGATLDVGLEAVDGSGFLDVLSTVADDPDFLTATVLDVAAAGLDLFGEDLANQYGYLTEKNVWVTLTVGGAVLAAGTIVKGDIEYVVD